MPSIREHFPDVTEALLPGYERALSRYRELFKLSLREYWETYTGITGRPHPTGVRQEGELLPWLIREETGFWHRMGEGQIGHYSVMVENEHRLWSLVRFISASDVEAVETARQNFPDEFDSSRIVLLRQSSAFPVSGGDCADTENGTLILGAGDMSLFVPAGKLVAYLPIRGTFLHSRCSPELGDRLEVHHVMKSPGNFRWASIVRRRMPNGGGVQEREGRREVKVF